MDRKSLLIAVGGGLASVLLMFYLAFVNHIEPAHVGIARDWVTGEMWLDHPGWHITAPWVKVARIDARPTRVCITSASKARNCKLAQFEPSAWKEFVETEGFRYYWWANRFSFNCGYEEEYRGMKDILRGYAFSSVQFPFVTVQESN